VSNYQHAVLRGDIIALAQQRKRLIRQARSAAMSEELGEAGGSASDDLFDEADVLDQRIFELLDKLEPEGEG
jgi:hypothetical protein